MLLILHYNAPSLYKFCNTTLLLSTLLFPGSDSSGKALMTTVIALVVGVAALAVVVAFLLIRMRRNANKAPPATDNIGIDNAPNGKVYANDDENVGKGESVF